MSTVSLFFKMLGNTWKKLCRRGILPVLLLVFCIAVAAAGFLLAERAFTQENVFPGLILGITWQEEDAGNETLTDLLGKMRDVSAYCEIRSYPEYSSGRKALKNGELDGLLVLPAGFASEVMNDRNPDVELYVSDEDPLGSLLLIRIGQAAADLLSSSQAGIYATLYIYNDYPSETLSFNDVLTDINLLFIRNAMNRSQMFRLSKVSNTGSLTIGQHYFCSIFCYLLMALSALYTGHCRPEELHPLHRLRAAGRSPFVCWLSAVAAPWIILMPLTILLSAGTRSLADGIPQDLSCLSGISWKEILFPSAAAALLISLFAVFCRLAGRTMSGCFVLSFVLSGAMLVVSGGILPPTLLPSGMRSVMWLSPLTGLREMLSGQTVLSVSARSLRGGLFSSLPAPAVSLLLWTGVFACISYILYARTVKEATE